MGAGVRSVQSDFMEELFQSLFSVVYLVDSENPRALYVLQSDCYLWREDLTSVWVPWLDPVFAHRVCLRPPLVQRQQGAWDVLRTGRRSETEQSWKRGLMST